MRRNEWSRSSECALHDKLADLGMELGHLGVAVRLNLKALVVKDPCQLLDRLSLPRRDQVRMKLVPCRELRDRPLALHRLKRDLRLELGREPSARLHGGSSFSSSDPP